METLERKAQRYAGELELEIRAANIRGALRLVEDWALSREARLAVARALDQRLRTSENEHPVLRGFTGFDRARIGRLVEASKRRRR